MFNEELHNLYIVCSSLVHVAPMGEIKNAYILVGKPKGKKPPG
jgi:hypothetical protein